MAAGFADSLRSEARLAVLANLRVSSRSRWRRCTVEALSEPAARHGGGGRFHLHFTSRTRASRFAISPAGERVCWGENFRRQWLERGFRPNSCRALLRLAPSTLGESCACACLVCYFEPAHVVFMWATHRPRRVEDLCHLPHRLIRHHRRVTLFIFLSFVTSSSSRPR